MLSVTCLLQQQNQCFNRYLAVERGVQEWRIDESARLPPMWPGFNSWTRRHMWVELSEFSGSPFSTESITSKVNLSIL